VCVCVCVCMSLCIRTVNVEVSDLSARYLPCWFTSTPCRSYSKVKVKHCQSSRLGLGLELRGVE